MEYHKITSEINSEIYTPPVSKYKISETKIPFQYPSNLLNPEDNEIKYDEDGDIVLPRNKKGELVIEHKMNTELPLVGLQLWRGALLLADYILANLKLFHNQNILELGSGVGLTSIVASMIAKEVICTDIDSYGIIEVIKRNFKRNSKYVKAKVQTMELNFLDTNWSPRFMERLNKTSIILAADVIYDNDITEGFVNTLAKLFNSDNRRVAFVALEKRFVFTISDLDSVAPMYEEFIYCIKRKNLKWKIEMLKTDFPQYFQYNRVSHMILMKIYIEQ
ncbi:methyltransferase-like protein 22 [Chelonus insularis]|uniref:methyltransferase-like protein 22 n=1 Tax=Chelonus insularis TaxID=460826 RepID=UPI001589F7A8|nr:methyltransferase-like protein 22 [Chelonus insularis]